MTKKELAAFCVEELKKLYPEAKCSLNAETPFQLLIATRLSAQCTDARVNIVTPSLFAEFGTAEKMAAAPLSRVEDHIKSCGLYKQKAKDLIGIANGIINDFGGEVPDTIEALTTLPGVGRKTANVIQAVAFGKATMAVDTHVFRVSHRLGLVSERATTPLKVEQELVKHIPQEVIPQAHHWLLLHGRYVCTSKKPHCVIRMNCTKLMLMNLKRLQKRL